jgi:hypothetical protein
VGRQQADSGAPFEFASAGDGEARDRAIDEGEKGADRRSEKERPGGGGDSGGSADRPLGLETRGRAEATNAHERPATENGRASEGRGVDEGSHAGEAKPRAESGGTEEKRSAVGEIAWVGFAGAESPGSAVRARSIDALQDNVLVK